MASLILGVLDVAYAEAHGPNGKEVTTTTGKVAEILEQRYHVMESFFALRRSKIGQFLADGMATALQDLVSGRPTLGNAMFDVSQRIEAEFRSFLDANELQKMSLAIGAGPLSRAAFKGVNHRKKHPYAKRNGRPAFVDTGLYRASFRAQVKL